MRSRSRVFGPIAALLGFLIPHAQAEGVVEVSSLAELASATAQSGQHIRLKPGTYRMVDYLTVNVLAEIAQSIDREHRRPPVPMFVFRGSDNVVDLRDCTLEIDTDLYRRVPQGGYTRCLIVEGSGNHLIGLTIRNTGPSSQGSGGNILSIAGERNTLEAVTLHVHGSWPYGYGDLLGKGGPNLVPLQKQSGIQILGSGSLLRRCRVYSRAFGHCFYIQGGEDIRLEDCYAEGAVRSTNDMLAETSGPAYEQGFRSVYRNRDGRFAISPGYIKSLSEDGFRTYGAAGSASLINCIAVNTRAGFEIGGRDDATTKTFLDGCIALGCERAFLIGSHTIIRRSRGDVAHGPLLYLRGGRDSDIELELIGTVPVGLVHSLATIAGENHKVWLSAQEGHEPMPALPILVGFGMPAHAEMASGTNPASTANLLLVNKIDFAPVITSETITGAKGSSTSRRFKDTDLRKDPGTWGLPASGIATGRR